MKKYFARLMGFVVLCSIGSGVAYGQAVPDSLLARIQALKSRGDQVELAKTEYALSKYYYNTYADSLALLHLEQTINAATKAREPRTLLVANNLLGTITGDAGDHEKALGYYHVALKLALDIGNDTLRSSVLNNIGLELKAQGKYKDAVETLYESLALKEKIGASKKSLSSAHLNIGNILDILEQPDEALRYYEQSLKLKKELGDSLGISRLLSNMAVIEKNRRNFSRAIDLIAESTTYNATAKDLEQDYVNHTNLGNIYKNLGQEEQAKAEFEAALIHAQKLENSDYLSDIHQNLASLYSSGKNYSKSIFHLQEALNYAQESNSWVLFQEIHLGLSQAHAAQHQYEDAHFHLARSDVYRDSIFTLEGQKAIQEIKTKYETEKKEKEIVLQNLSIAKAEIVSRKKTTVIILLISGFLLLSAGAWITFRIYRQRQRRNVALAQQKLAIARQKIDTLQSAIHAQLGKSPAGVKIALSREDINHYLIDPLSEREKDVLKHISLGKTNKEIAEAIFVSENTVKFHLKNVYLKLEVKNRTEALTKADALNIW